DLVALVQAEVAAAGSPAARIEALNAFKDREMFRVDMRYILGEVADFGQFSAELTDVAEATLQAAWRLAHEELIQRYGIPRDANGAECPLAICALGKFGGGELGFASDIELMFVYDGAGETAGPEIVGVAEFFNKLVDQTVHAVHARRSGVFQVDLRFRPYGEAGNLAVSLDLFRSYFGPEGAAWPYERQGLVKLRTIAGDPGFGATLTALRDELVYRDTPFDVQAMRAMRERQLRQLVSAGTTNAKFGPGGVVEIEYLVQGLQITHGRRFPELRTTNTLDALAALARAGLLSHGDYRGLRDAYIFHRRLIDGLRVVRGHAKDLTVPPADSVEFRFLARRLTYGEDVLRLRDDLSRHAERVLEIARRVL
ncbi:MAG TPA: glutamine synthetase adenylyltransferase, partial [Planctomycetaceae bacterium]|nr:glutamine synthetase adenylyltransferase [Planctomycetaceae bacterium]